MERDWKETLLREARLHGMCEENRALLAAADCDKLGALKLYQQTIDWALEEGYPSLDFLRKEFSGMEREGLFIDKKFTGELIDSPLCCVFHNCTGHITVDINMDEEIIPMLYFANGCSMVVDRDIYSECDEQIHVPLYVFGDNSVYPVQDESVKFTVYNINIK